MSERILVTGGTGFLGRRLTETLAGRGEQLRVLVRASSNIEGLAGPNVELVEGDLADESTWDRALEGCDRVFHAAAVVKKWARDRRIFDRVNVEAVDRLLTRAPAHGVRRIVLTSSFMALGPSPEDGTLGHENQRPQLSPHNDYERTKRAADEVIQRHLSSGACEIITTYPGVIYGPGLLTEGNILVKTFRDFLRGKLPGIPGSGRQRWCYAFVDDVVEGHRLAMQAGQPGRRYLLGGDNVTIDEVFGHFARLSGRAPLRRHLPIGLLSIVGATEELLAWLFGREPELTRGIASIYRHSWAYRSDTAENELGYRPRTFASGLEETWSWMQSQGLDQPRA